MKPGSKALPLWTPLDTRRCWQLVAVGLIVRLALLAFAFGVTGQSWHHYLSTSDGGSYLQVAEVVFTNAARDTITFYDSRVFTGWPIAYGWLLLLLPAPVAALGATLIAASVAPAILYILTRSWSVALALVWLTPAWLLASVHPIAESFYLLMGLTALWAWQRGRLTTAGFAIGMMCAAKPYGLFLALPLSLLIARTDDRWNGGRLVRFIFPVAILASGFALLNGWLYDDWLRQFHVYSAPLAQLNLARIDDSALAGAHGHWGAPFKALLGTPLQTRVPAWKTVYIYAHVAGLIFFLGRALWRQRAAASPLDQVLLGWFVLNSVAIVCGGPYWGFHSFDRYFVWAWPAALVLNGDLVERHPRWHAAAAVASVAVTLFALQKHHA